MRNFKKRTIALILASAVTVAGSFAANRYKNTLMGIGFGVSNNGAMEVVVQTKTQHSEIIKPIKKDENTYILMLPEMDSSAPTPDLSSISNIQSINISTMPYTNEKVGYTKITIKTNNVPALAVVNQIFIEDKSSVQTNATETSSNSLSSETYSYQNYDNQSYYSEEDVNGEYVEEETYEEDASTDETNSVDDSSSEVTEAVDYANYDLEKEKRSREHFLLILGFLLVVFCSVFFYLNAKDKLAELSGESLDIDVKEDEKKAPKEKNKKLKNIKNTILTLDATYSKSATVQNKKEIFNNIKSDKQVIIPSKTNEEEPVEDNVVDLDKLFQEQVQSKNTEKTDEEYENEALEDFLSGFSFDEEFFEEEAKEEEIEEEKLYNEELFEKVINGNYKFNKGDIDCINKLMSMEIDDHTVKNIDKYITVSNPIKAVSKDKVLEDLITTYKISHDINFTQDDITALRKLINCEIDPDFITDLRTNPQKTREMSEEISKPKPKRAKPSEILTLNVGDLLPDLSEAMKKQGNKPIKSDYKAGTVYFSEGYEVRTLSIQQDELPDLSLEINNESAYISKPSAEIELVDNSYEFETLTISSELPNLAEAALNPKNYEHPEEENIVVDADALLKNINNVQFKPFYDGSEKFEVINDLDDFYADDVPDFDEIQRKALERNYLDLDAKYKKETEVIKEVEAPKVLKEELPKKQVKKSDEVLNRIREKRNSNIEVNRPHKRNLTKSAQKESKKYDTICNVENESYNVLSSVEFGNNLGCHLVKNSSGYAVIGFIGDKLTKIKTYSELKSEKIQARISEKIDDETSRYLVRIGLKKFVLEVKSDEIKFVMDLC